MRTKSFFIMLGLWILFVIVVILALPPARAQAACSVRSDWPTYTVARGDTLYLIARRYSATTTILAIANCLTNSNTIYVGQQLRVPGAGGGATLTPIPSTETKPITFQPYEGGYLLWWAESGDIWELTGAQGGSLTNYPSRTYGDLPDNPVQDSTPANRVRPIMGFGRLWGNFALVRSQLGWATTSEQSFISTVNYDAVSRKTIFTVPGGRTFFSDGHSWSLFTGTIPTPPPPQPTVTPPGVLNVSAAFQPFEHGFMVWDSSNGLITAYFGTNGGTIASFPSSDYAYLPENRISNPPPGRFSPILGFGKVWGNNDSVRNQLGWATSQELSYAMAVRHSAGETSFDFQIPVGREYTWIFNYNYRTWNYESGSPIPTSPPVVLPPATPAPSTNGFVVTTNAAYQVFEDGFMIWRADTGDIWVFPKHVNVNYFSLLDYQNLPDNPVKDTPPTARLLPINGFGRVWGNVSQIRSALGWALDTEKSYSATLHIIHVMSPDGVKSLSGLCLNLPDGSSVQFPQYADATTITWGLVDSCG
ncbi:MAG: LysM peptidoglycan-binding domain-containing protein [Chloroflexota bacterium]